MRQICPLCHKEVRVGQTPVPFDGKVFHHRCLRDRVTRVKDLVVKVLGPKSQ
jgi:hypothetical protein